MRWKKTEKKVYKTGKPFLSLLPTRCHFCEYTFWLEWGFILDTGNLIPTKCFRCSDCQWRTGEYLQEKICPEHYTLESIYL